MTDDTGKFAYIESCRGIRDPRDSGLPFPLSTDNHLDKAPVSYIPTINGTRKQP